MIRHLSKLERQIAKFVRDREEVVFFALCALVGVAGAVLGELFKISVDLMRMMLAPGSNVLTAFEQLSPWARVAVPAIGVVAAEIVEPRGV